MAAEEKCATGSTIEVKPAAKEVVVFEDISPATSVAYAQSEVQNKREEVHER